MSILRQESLGSTFWDFCKNDFIKSFSSISIELSPEGTERFFALTDGDAEDLAEEANGSRSSWCLPTVQYEIGGKVLSANMSSFTEEEIENLVKAGWIRTVDGFVHEDMLRKENNEDFSEAENGITSK